MGGVSRPTDGPGGPGGPPSRLDLPDGQTVRCRVVNVKDDGTIQVVPDHAVAIQMLRGTLLRGSSATGRYRL
jgi:hypothetical protein